MMIDLFDKELGFRITTYLFSGRAHIEVGFCFLNHMRLLGEIYINSSGDKLNFEEEIKPILGKLGEMIISKIDPYLETEDQKEKVFESANNASMVFDTIYIYIPIPNLVNPHYKEKFIDENHDIKNLFTSSQITYDQFEELLKDISTECEKVMKEKENGNVESNKVKGI